ncbi:MAG TPA: MFS transporter [Armatimonadetes bacterium]|nr:MFS transporter [Armatimonadota bacterium]
MAQPHDQPPTHYALAYSEYRRYATGALLSNIGLQMMAVAVSWQIYRLTHSTLALGLVGLAEVIPVVGLALPGGQLADIFSRRRLVLGSSLGILACCLALAALASGHLVAPDAPALIAANQFLENLARRMGEQQVHFDSTVVPVMYVVIFFLGVTRAIMGPARSALLPMLVPATAFPNAVTWNSSFFQLAAMAGPALGGLILGFTSTGGDSYAPVYLLSSASVLVLIVAIYSLPEKPYPHSEERHGLESMLVGLRFVHRQKVILGSIALDMFAVLLGGVTALLPVYADEILHVGPRGLGILRAAPSVGSFLMAIWLAHHPPIRRAGPALFWSVTAFGVGIIVFGLSRSFWLSLAALFFCGLADNISVVVRHTLVQILTPDSLRGRVSAVNQIFISLSNELGALRAGTVAAVVGPVLSTVGGGVGTILVAGVAAILWPGLRRYGSLAVTKLPETEESVEP